MTIITSRRTTPAADVRIDDTSWWLLLYCAVAQRKIGREEKERGRHVRALGDSNCYWLEMDSAVEGHRAIRGWMHGWRETRERRLKGEGDWSKNKPLGIFQNKNKKTKNFFFFFFFFFSYFIISFLFFFFLPLFTCLMPFYLRYAADSHRWMWCDSDHKTRLSISSGRVLNFNIITVGLGFDSHTPVTLPLPFSSAKMAFLCQFTKIKSNQYQTTGPKLEWNNTRSSLINFILFYFILSLGILMSFNELTNGKEALKRLRDWEKTIIVGCCYSFNPNFFYFLRRRTAARVATGWSRFFFLLLASCLLRANVVIIRNSSLFTYVNEYVRRLGHLKITTNDLPFFFPFFPFFFLQIIIRPTTTAHLLLYLFFFARAVGGGKKCAQFAQPAPQAKWAFAPWKTFMILLYNRPSVRPSARFLGVLFVVDVFLSCRVVSRRFSGNKNLNKETPMSSSQRTKRAPNIRFFLSSYLRALIAGRSPRKLLSKEFSHMTTRDDNGWRLSSCVCMYIVAGRYHHRATNVVFSFLKYCRRETRRRIRRRKQCSDCQLNAHFFIRVLLLSNLPNNNF